MAPIPIVFLKTCSIPHDAYKDYFNAPERAHPASPSSAAGPTYKTVFVPTLEHRLHGENLHSIRSMLRSGDLAERYGGMIFTSGRAVETFASVVGDEEQRRREDATRTGSREPALNPQSRHPTAITMDFFPLYAVGPATARQLTTLHSSAPLTFRAPCPPRRVEGADTGNGAALASYILQSYNALYADFLFEFYEAPRLPFIPLLGNSSVQYSRRRLERDDRRLRKKPLLFLVGETRRDIVPKTLQAAPAEQSIQVDEVEVYRTELADGFSTELRKQTSQLEQQNLAAGSPPLMVLVVFSPQACESMLLALDLSSAKDPSDITPTASTAASTAASNRSKTKYILVTIGPTTRDHLRDRFNFHADACAATPSPKGVEDALLAYFRDSGVGAPH